jgi:hypothetical protein
MNRHEYEYYNSINRIADALEKIVKILNNDREIKTKNKSMERDKVSK